MMINNSPLTTEEVKTTTTTRSVLMQPSQLTAEYLDEPESPLIFYCSSTTDDIHGHPPSIWSDGLRSSPSKMMMDYASIDSPITLFNLSANSPQLLLSSPSSSSSSNCSSSPSSLTTTTTTTATVLGDNANCASMTTLDLDHHALLMNRPIMINPDHHSDQLSSEPISLNNMIIPQPLTTNHHHHHLLNPSSYSQQQLLESMMGRVGVDPTLQPGSIQIGSSAGHNLNANHPHLSSLFQRHHPTTTAPPNYPVVMDQHNINGAMQTVISTVGTPSPSKTPPATASLVLASKSVPQPTPTQQHSAKVIKSNRALAKLQSSDSAKATPGSTTSSSSSKNEATHGRSTAANQFCKICGDTPIGKNFGVVTCGSCKIFFSRNIDSKERLQCRNHNRCMDGINKSNRRNCSACRLDKCIRLGMRVKRNRQKSTSSTLPDSSVRNQQRTLSESSNKSLGGNTTNHSFQNHQTESSGGSDYEMTNHDEDMMDDVYGELPTLVPIDQVNGCTGHHQFENQHHLISANHDYLTSNNQMPMLCSQQEGQYENDLNMIPQNDQSIPIESASNDLTGASAITTNVIQTLLPQPARPQPQPFFNSVSVIQQAPPSRPSSSATNIIPTNSSDCPITDNEDNDGEEEEEDEAEEEEGEEEEEEAEEEEEEGEEEKAAVQKPSTEDPKKEEEEAKMLTNYHQTSPSSMYAVCLPFHSYQHHNHPNDGEMMVQDHIGYHHMDIEDDSTLEQRDVFNFSHVQTSINAHTRYNYTNFYDENYYRYYCLPENYHRRNYYDSGDNGQPKFQSLSCSSVELCKVEARNFGDQDHALIAELEKWKPVIRIKLGLDYTVANEESNFNYHQLFAKEHEKISDVNNSCRMISAKPRSHDELRAIFNSLERGIFYANKSFNLYEDFWGESEISELIRQNETGFNRQKNNLLHMLYHLRGVQNFDEQFNAWAIFNGNDDGFTLVKLDMFQQSVKKEMALTHRQYITSFPKEWRLDPTIFNLMTYLLLFDAFDRPHSPFKCEKLIYFQYLYLFKRYIECMYNDKEKAQQMLLWMLKLIRQLTPLCSECLTACTHSLNPAVLRKIGPNYAQCLMMEENKLKMQNQQNDKHGHHQHNHNPQGHHHQQQEHNPPQPVPSSSSSSTTIDGTSAGVNG